MRIVRAKEVVDCAPCAWGSCLWVCWAVWPKVQHCARLKPQLVMK